MEQLIHAFGIDIKLITVQVINFLVLLAALSYFLYKPVLKLLNDREEKIKQGILDAEAAAAAKAEAGKEKEAILTEANQNAQTVVAKAEAHAKDKSADIIKEAEDRAANIVTNAETASDDIKDKARKESEAEIAKLAVLAAEKVLRKEA